MQTIIFLLLLFLGVVFSILLYINNKSSRLKKLNSGQCPSCHEKAKEFFDTNTNTKFKHEIISARLLKDHGCSGLKEIEYSCKSCGLKEVHSSN
jgi:nitrate/TMAO reductase-like tetraheme cytochrome c subunit